MRAIKRVYYIYKSEVCADNVIKSNVPIKFRRARNFPRQTPTYLISGRYVRIVRILHITCHLRRCHAYRVAATPPRSRIRNDVTCRGEKTKGDLSLVSRGRNRVGGKELLALCKVTCIAARAAQAERMRAHCVHVWRRGALAGEPRRSERRKQGWEGVVLMENRSQCDARGPPTVISRARRAG